QAAERRRENRGDQRQSERHAHAAHEARQHITAKHRKDAMRQIDKAHHAHRYRQADRDQVQHHRKGQAVKPDADKRGEGVAQSLTSTRVRRPGESRDPLLRPSPTLSSRATLDACSLWRGWVPAFAGTPGWAGEITISIWAGSALSRGP